MPLQCTRSYFCVRDLINLIKGIARHLASHEARNPYESPSKLVRACVLSRCNGNCESNPGTQFFNSTSRHIFSTRWCITEAVKPVRSRSCWIHRGSLTAGLPTPSSSPLRGTAPAAVVPSSWLPVRFGPPPESSCQP